MMKPIPPVGLRCLALFTFVALGGMPALMGFPPAPFHTVFGLVRDESGRTLRVEGAQVVFYRGATEVFRQTIRASTLPDQNYQLRLRMDMQRPGTVRYSDLANDPGSAFTLGVVLNNVVYRPIEMSTAPAIGRPGERVRLDLTLGVDADGDGLPDAWEQSQLFAGGNPPGPDGWDLSLIDRDGDFDGDGVSNFQEYLAGTYATDATDYLAIEAVGLGERHAQLRFFAVAGKTYSLEASPDLQAWSAVPVYLSDPEALESEEESVPSAAPAPQATVHAETSDFTDLYAPTAEGRRTFYRLKVR